jgi:hypothetical protein
MRRDVASGIVASAVVISFAFAAAISPAAPLNAGASAAGVFSRGVASERIDGAFASLSMVNADPADAAIATPTTPKGDLRRLPECASSTWPNVDASCLSTADGSSAPRVRSITTGYQSGINTTVLIRIPGAAVAQR